MAMDPRGGQIDLPGEHMKEPAFGLPATWIDENLREEAAFRGYTVVDPATVLTTHLTEILKDNMSDLLSWSELQKLVKELPAEQKKLWDDLIPSVTTATTVQRVLQALLKERVSIRDFTAILEGIGEAAAHTPGVMALVEHVRGRLARQLCWQNRAEDGALPIVSLSPEWEHAFAEALIGPGEEKQLALAPSKLQEFIRQTRDAFDRAAQAGETGVLLTSAQHPPLCALHHRAVQRANRGDEPERNPPQGAVEDGGRGLGSLFRLPFLPRRPALVLHGDEGAPEPVSAPRIVAPGQPRRVLGPVSRIVVHRLPGARHRIEIGTAQGGRRRRGALGGAAAHASPSSSA